MLGNFIICQHFSNLALQSNINKSFMSWPEKTDITALHFGSCEVKGHQCLDYSCDRVDGYGFRRVLC